MRIELWDYVDDLMYSVMECSTVPRKNEEIVFDADAAHWLWVMEVRWTSDRPNNPDLLIPRVYTCKQAKGGRA